MGEFRVHHVRFFEYMPHAIHGLAYQEKDQRLAVARADGSIEIWSIEDDWYQEKWLPPEEDHSVEALVWCGSRLFSAGLHGNLHEHDLLTCSTKSVMSSNSGAIWCLTANDAQTHIAAGTEDGCVVLFAVTDEGVQYDRSLDKQEGRILSIAWHSQENLIITGGLDNIRVWSSTSGHAIQRLTLGRQERNKETIVWAVAVTKDLTIISGDSRGKTCFWNGKHGTLIKGIKSHKADVLALAVNAEGTSVFSSGVDPTLAQFEFIASQPNSDWKMWVPSKLRVQHTHDVRAVAVTKAHVVTGGVDCNLIFNPIEGKLSPKSWRRLPPVPTRPLVAVAVEAELVLLQYAQHLELWRLGSTSRNSDKPGTVLHLKRTPVKLLELKSKGQEAILSSAISSDGRWLAYSDQNSLRLFSVTIEETVLDTPKMGLSRVRRIPQEVQPARCLCFTPGGAALLLASCHGQVQLLKTDATQPELIHTFPSEQESPPGIHLLETSHDGLHFATGDHSNNVHIYSIDKLKRISSLPLYKHQPSALTFHPTETQVCAVYTDQKIFEYDFTDHEYTEWCRQLNRWRHPQWMKRHGKVTQVTYHPERHHELMLRDEQMFCIINQQQRLPGWKEKLFNKAMKESGSEDTRHAFHFCNKYKYLLHLSLLPDNFLLVVERPPVAILEALPPTLKRKKFGT